MPQTMQNDVLPSPEGAVVAEVEPCTHPRVFGKLCAVCGANMDELRMAHRAQATTLRETESQSAAPPPELRTFNVRAGFQLSISQQEAQRADDRIHQRLLAARKLALVLDLDHTLIHATSDDRARLLLGHSACFSLSLWRGPSQSMPSVLFSSLSKYILVLHLYACFESDA